MRWGGFTAYRGVVAYRRSTAPLSIFLTVALGGCFNPDQGGLDTDTDTDGTDGTSGSMSGMTSMTMTSPDATGNPTTMDDGTTADDADTSATGTTDDGMPACNDDGDCADMAGECEVAICTSLGACQVGDAAEGAACGDTAETQCNAADTCDANGECQENIAFDGMDCSDCDGAQCTCGAGTCAGCVAYADTNLFTTERSLIGWELSGDWRLYTEAPRSQPGSFSPAAIPFGNQVLGTDGNRRAPYPNGHAERSYARTPPTELPSSITFQSWHLDEGNGLYDNKIIRISTDGGMSWTDIISCPLNPALAFCARIETREADDWDSISLDLPAPLIGQVGIIEFAYDTRDGCCDFEKGWFIDVTNFATECACAADNTCAQYGDACGEGVCGGNGGCNLDATPQDTACGDTTDDTCTNPDTCDGDGYCRPRNGNTNLVACTECDNGQDCNGCEAGVCADCADSPEIHTFDFLPFGSPIQGWTTNNITGGGWSVFGNIPSNEDNTGVLSPMDAPFLGIDGNIQGAPDGVGETATAQITSRQDVIPEAITFQSWHQDQGGASLDLKRIDLSVDDGMTWIPLADCAAADPLDDFPFCSNVNFRDPEDWDDITLDTSMWEDMEGMLRFTYDTVTACCGFERGWYIDELNFAQACLEPNLSNFNVPCEFLPQDVCESDYFCAWDGADCIACNMLSGEDCDASPICEPFVYPDVTTCVPLQQ